MQTNVKYGLNKLHNNHSHEQDGKVKECQRNRPCYGPSADN